MSKYRQKIEKQQKRIAALLATIFVALVVYVILSEKSSEKCLNEATGYESGSYKVECGKIVRR